MRLFQEVLTDSRSGRIILKMLVWGGCSTLTQESRCKKNWGACVTVADSLWDRQVFIQRIDVGLKCLGLLRFKRSSTEGRTHGLPRTLLVTTCCSTNLPFNPTPLQFFLTNLGPHGNWIQCTELRPNAMGTQVCQNGDPMGTQKLKKGPMGTRVPRWGPTCLQCHPTT